MAASFRAGVSLQFRNKKTRQTLSQQISAKGEFEFKQGLPPATYDVFVANLGDTVVRSLTATGARVSGLTLQISGAAPVTLTVVVTDGIGKVEGTALKNDKPLAGAMIILVPDDAAHNAALFRRDQSDSDGTFNLNSVLPGRYTVLALENGWDLDRTKSDVYQPYLAQGTVVQVTPKGKYEVEVKVQ